MRILVVVASVRARPSRAEVEEGSASTAIGRGLVGPKAQGKPATQNRHGFFFFFSKKKNLSRARVGWDYPLDLSISSSGGKETYRDSPSSGERRGKKPKP